MRTYDNPTGSCLTTNLFLAFVLLIFVVGLIQAKNVFLTSDVMALSKAPQIEKVETIAYPNSTEGPMLAQAE